MPDFAYLSAVFLGAVALVVEANRQYRKPIPDYLSPGKGLVDPAALATPGGHLRGLGFYAFCYLVLYFALLSSALLRSLWLATDPNQAVAGAQSFLDNDEARSILAEEGTATPLYISTTLIAALSLGVGQQFEGILRTIAYWLAGIPRGFYYIVDSLRAFDYAKLGDGGRKGPLMLAYDARQADLAALASAAEMQLVSDNARACDILAFSVLDREGERWWPRASLQDFGRDIAPLDTRQKALAQKLMKGATPADLTAASAELRSLRAALEDIFAQLYINSGSRTSTPPRESKTRPIIVYLQKKGLGFSAVSAEAALIAFILSVPVYFAVDALFQALRDASFRFGAVTWDRLIRTDLTGGFATALASCARFACFIWVALQPRGGLPGQPQRHGRLAARQGPAGPLPAALRLVARPRANRDRRLLRRLARLSRHRPLLQSRCPHHQEPSGRLRPRCTGLLRRLLRSRLPDRLLHAAHHRLAQRASPRLGLGLRPGLLRPLARLCRRPCPGDLRPAPLPRRPGAALREDSPGPRHCRLAAEGIRHHRHQGGAAHLAPRPHLLRHLRHPHVPGAAEVTPLARRAGLLLALTAAPLAAQEAPAGQSTDAPIEAATREECAADTGSIRVGVRNDARPFSYKLEGTRRSDSRLPRPRDRYYDGYVARICGNVMAEVERQHRTSFAVCPIDDPRQRFDLLEAGEIDILCDPSTITDPRLEKLMSSPPIYLSGITVATNPTLPAAFPCGALIGVVGGTTSDQYGIVEILKAGEFPKLETEIREALANDAVRPECLKAAEEAGHDAAAYREPPIYLGPSHDDVARRFCNHEIAYYVGDIEIVKANLDTIPNCPYKGASMTYTDERYAIFGHVPVGGPQARLTGILQFFRELSEQALNQDSVLISSYNSTFPDATPSVKLKALYWSLTGIYPVRE